MYRGTTPTLKFTLPFDTSTLDAVWVTIAQGGTWVLQSDVAAVKQEIQNGNYKFK